MGVDVAHALPPAIAVSASAPPSHASSLRNCILSPPRLESNRRSMGGEYEFRINERTCARKFAVTWRLSVDYRHVAFEIRPRKECWRSDRDRDTLVVNER